MGSMDGKSGKESGSERWSCAGQVFEESVLGVPGADLVDGRVVFGNGAIEDFDLIEDEFHFHHCRLDEVEVFSERDEVLHDGQTLDEAALTTAAMAAKECFQSALSCSFEILGRGPSPEKIEVHRSPDVLVEYLDCLGIVVFQECLQPVGESGSLIDKAAPGFAKCLKTAQVPLNQVIGGEFGMVAFDEVGNVTSVGLVGPSPRDNERLTMRPGGGWIEAVESDAWFGSEKGHEVGRRLFEGDGDFGIGEALAKLAPPLVKGFRRRGDLFFGSFTGGRLKRADSERGIGAIDSDD